MVRGADLRILTLMKRLWQITVLCAALLAGGCGYDDFGPYTPSDEDIVPANIDIGRVMELYSGEVVTVYDDLVIGGYVSANDKSGNFYNTFIIEDPTGAIEVKAGLYELHTAFPMGRYVAIKCKGLCVSDYNGVLQLGLPPEAGSNYTKYFDSRHILNLYVFYSDRYKAVEPTEIGVAGLHEKMCGRLVTIDGLRFVSDEAEGEDARPETRSGQATWATPYSGPGTTPVTGYRAFADAADNRIAVVTSGYADFAGEAVPFGEVSLTGILMYGKTDTGRKMFMLKMRDLRDVAVETN